EEGRPRLRGEGVEKRGVAEAGAAPRGLMPTVSPTASRLAGDCGPRSVFPSRVCVCVSPVSSFRPAPRSSLLRVVSRFSLSPSPSPSPHPWCQPFSRASVSRPEGLPCAPWKSPSSPAQPREPPRSLGPVQVSEVGRQESHSIPQESGALSL
ncbi:Hypothetical predicted protein, partial [Marmota monax]